MEIKSIGIILDGNRRWAKAKNLPSLLGHQVGSEKVKEILSWVYEAGVEELILYVFSAENWNRSKDEVSYLMDLIDRGIKEWARELTEKGIRIRFIGDLKALPEKMQTSLEAIEQQTKEGTKGTLALALSYGGRQEILAGVNKLLASDAKEISEEDLRSAMWSADLKDPDLIIRTGGEKRLSNFLTWQSTYSELFFTDTLWPDFTKEEFDAILTDFAQRERRHGR
jgi:undecaprenyl diphosphate synthase